MRQRSAGKKLLMGVLLVLTGVVVLLNVYFPNYSRLKKIRAANQEVLGNISSVEKEIKIFQEQNKNMENNPVVMEKYARDQLGVAKEDEIVIDMEE